MKDFNLSYQDINTEAINKYVASMEADALTRLELKTRVSNDSTVVSDSYTDKVAILNQKLIDWNPNIDSKTTFADSKATLVGLKTCYNMSNSDIGRKYLINAVNKATESIAMLFEKTNASMVRLMIPHLKEITFGNFSDYDENISRETMAQQLISIASGSFIVMIDGTHGRGDKTRKFNHVGINKMILEKSIVKRIGKSNGPLQVGSWKSIIPTVTRPNAKTVYHKEVEYSVATLNYLEASAKYIFTVGTVGVENGDNILEYLKTRKDWGAICGTHKVKYVDGKETYIRVSDEPTIKGMVRIKSIIDNILDLRGKPFHLPVKLTGNSRSDYMSNKVGLAPHGDSFEKAIFEQFNKLVISVSGKEQVIWAMVTEIAGKKMSLKKALRWFMNTSNKESVLNSTFSVKELYEKKLVQAYHDSISGTPTGFLLAADGTNSGAQFWGTILQDKDVCQDANMSGMATFYDMYDKAAKTFGEKILVDLTRANLKSAVQSWLYGAHGATMMSAKKNDDYQSLNEVLEGRTTLSQADLELLVYSTMCELYPRLASAIQMLAGIQQDILKEAGGSITGFQWKNAIGTGCQSVNLEQGKTDIIYFIDKDNKVRERSIQRAVPNHKSKTGNFAPNGIHSLDASALMITTMAIETVFLHAHDEYRCHPNFMAETRVKYVNTIVDIAEASYFERACEEAFGFEVEFDKGDFPFSKMRKSVNALV